MLKWHAYNGAAAPPSTLDGDFFDTVVINQREVPIRLYWMDRMGRPKLYGGIAARGKKRQQTRPGDVWMITDDEDEQLGHITVAERGAQVVIPAP